MSNLENPKYLSVNKLAEARDLPLGGLRGWLFNRESNGLNTAVIKVGRKILVDVHEFDKWLENFREAKVVCNS